jgi:hypothetical protein
MITPVKESYPLCYALLREVVRLLLPFRDNILETIVPKRRLQTTLRKNQKQRHLNYSVAEV